MDRGPRAVVGRGGGDRMRLLSNLCQCSAECPTENKQACDEWLMPMLKRPERHLPRRNALTASLQYELIQKMNARLAYALSIQFN